MQVFLTFGWDGDRTLLNSVYGQFNNVDILFVEAHQLTSFYTRMGKYFKHSQFTRDGVSNLHTLRKKNKGTMLLNVSNEEAEKMFLTCVAFSKIRIPYNAWDVVLYHTPFRSPVEKNLFELTTMNDVQAIILFFRECLDVNSPTRQATDLLHSRLTLWDTLFECLAPCSQCIVIVQCSDFFKYAPTPPVVDLLGTKAARD